MSAWHSIRNMNKSGIIPNKMSQIDTSTCICPSTCIYAFKQLLFCYVPCPLRTWTIWDLQNLLSVAVLSNVFSVCQAPCSATHYTSTSSSWSVAFHYLSFSRYALLVSNALNLLSSPRVQEFPLLPFWSCVYVYFVSIFLKTSYAQ